jgi:translation initiation factor IF-1
MAKADQIHARGTVVEILKHGAYRVELANGHRCIARASGEHRLNFIRLTAGDKVSLEFHPYDLSRGRIILPSE